MSNLKIIKPIKQFKPRYVVSERHMLKLKPRLPLSDSSLVKLTFKERFKVRIENIIEQIVLTIQEYSYIINAFLLGILFAATIATTLIICQKNIDKKIAEPLQKIYDTVISEFNI